MTTLADNLAIRILSVRSLRQVGSVSPLVLSRGLRSRGLHFSGGAGGDGGDGGDGTWKHMETGYIYISLYIYIYIPSGYLT